MRIAIPVNDSEGERSDICGHFGSAPFFAIVDTEQGDLCIVPNSNSGHVHGACSPIEALMPHSVNAVVVQGIGMNAYAKLKAAGICVFQSGALTVSDIIHEMDKGALLEVNPEQVCQGHDAHSHG